MASKDANSMAKGDRIQAMAGLRQLYIGFGTLADCCTEDFSGSEGLSDPTFK